MKQLSTHVARLAVFAVFCLIGNAWSLDGVPYLDTDGEMRAADGVVVIDADGGARTLNEGWYLVRGAFTNDWTITIDGAVHLILEDGSDLGVKGYSPNAGINVSEGNSLSIYAQSAGEDMGKLAATGGIGGAGIGGGYNGNGGTVTINGGAVTAIGGIYGAGIGGGGDGNGGTVTITGGTVTVTGGIGGNGGTVTITGGTVTATGGWVGIGGNGGTVTISGGIVAATGGDWGEGIGGSGSTVTITGGTVAAGGRIGISGSTFTLDGNAVVFASRITSGENRTIKSGILFIFDIGTGTILEGTPIAAHFPAEGITAAWKNQGSKSGIDYESGNKTGFIEVPSVTVIERIFINNVSYIDTNGTMQTADNVIVLGEDNISAIDHLNGWFLVRGNNLTRSATLWISGEAHIILEDGSDLAVNSDDRYNSNAGINVSEGNSLAIYAQSTGDNMGKLAAATGGSSGAGIGGGYSSSGGTVTITGGTVTATGSSGAGIGGYWNCNGGTITITGGTVTATGSWVGIGGNGGTVTITGGTVTATGGNDRYGIYGSTFTLDGNAVVFASSISATGENRILKSGILFIFNIGTATILEGTPIAASFPAEGITAEWKNQGSKSGIAYESGNETDFIEVTGVTLIERNFIDNVSYIDTNGTTQTANNVTLLGEDNISATDNLNGWFLVRGNLTRSTTLRISGEAHIILEDGSDLAVTGSINVSEGNSLAIYAQSTGDSMGKLAATNVSGGTVTISGGAVTATGGYYGINGSTVTITGGAVVTKGSISGNTFTLDGNAVVFASSISAGTNRILKSGILFIFNIGTATILEGTPVAASFPVEGMTAAWKNQGGKSGIAYTSGNKAGFIEVPYVTVIERIFINNVSYIGINGRTQTASNVIVLGEDNISAIDYLNGWFLVRGNNLTRSATLRISGEVHIILEDGSDLAVNGGINLSESNNLTIYAQSTGEDMGKLSTGTIGGGTSIVTITGGEVTATSIGYGGTATITGGEVTATSIGYGGTATITGGTVTAIGGIRGTFTLDGNAVVLASSINATDENLTLKSGFIFIFDIRTETVIEDTPVTTFFPAEGVTAAWAYRNGKSGIAYTRGGNESFAEIPGVTMVINNVPYIDEEGDQQIANNVRIIHAYNTGSYGYGSNNLNNGWYLVRGKITRSTTLTVSDEVHLILEDGSDLAVTASSNNAGINVSEGKSLTIYAQSTDNNMGKLTAVDYSAIGGSSGGNGGTVTINGGTVTGSIIGGTVTINDGTVTGGISGSEITISGGTVTGSSIIGGTVTINDGTVTATGNSYSGTGIGGNGGTVTITGGTVTATGMTAIGSGYSNNSAGIGGSNSAVTITGGTVTATGSGYSNIAGISGSTFTLGGNAAVYASSISATDENLTLESGILFVFNVGATTFLDGTSVAASFPTEGVTAAWTSLGDKSGIAYASEDSDGFIEIPGVTVIQRKIANSVPYIDTTGKLQTKDSVTVIDAENIETASNSNLSGWYLVRGVIDHTATLTVSDEVHLILENGSDLAVTGSSYNAGINVSESKSLTIYAQSTGNSMGKLAATGGSYGAGIGGDYSGNSDYSGNGGTVTIAGGTVTATGGSYGGAGIGGGGSYGGGSDGSGGTITITGGTVTATGGSYGIGGSGATVTINDGTVTATGSSYGIGGATVTINDGTVTATGRSYGIGGSTVTISGGTVTASSGYSNIAGISGSEITISGGTVEATNISGDEITINGGTVTGSISGDEITISGGTVMSIYSSKGTITIADGTVTGRISGSKGTVTITGGTVTGDIDGKTVTINDGTVTGRIDGDGTTITGGTVTGGISGSGIIIRGGTVMATGSIRGGVVTIRGGTVIATGGIIGQFALNGNAIVLADSVSDTEESRRTGGILFISGTGKVYGSVELQKDLNIISSYTLTIPKEATLTIPSSAKLTNNGAIIVCGTLNGTVAGNEPEETCPQEVPTLPQTAKSDRLITPTQNGITLTANTTATVAVYNLSGKLISQQNYNAGNHSISLGHLPKGVYIVKASHGGGKDILRVAVR
jgi:membrane-bound inhibitor of C-type lysozyme